MVTQSSQRVKGNLSALKAPNTDFAISESGLWLQAGRVYIADYLEREEKKEGERRCKKYGEIVGWCRGGGAWVAVWFEEVGGGGGCSHGFQEEPKGISHCQQSMKGRLLEIDRQLTSNKGGGGRKGGS